jgi:tetratricopeptide (TPR) repeat protein
MISKKNIYAILLYVPLLALTTSSYADVPTNERELAMLPEYCQGTQGLSKIRNLPKSAIDNYYKTYGETYHHLHHYCWALLTEYNATRIRDKGPRNNKYNQALGDIQYVLNKNPPASFPPLGDIYTTRARILFKMDRPGEAVADLMKAITLQPGNQRAYVQLSDYYLQIGQKDKAISTLEKGVENHEAPSMLLKRLDRLGKPYKGTPGSAIAKKQMADSPAIEQLSTDTPASAQSGTVDANNKGGPSGVDNAQPDNKTTEPVAPKDPANPYCRFCP